MIAGHDTTAYQLSWIIIELSRNPDVVAKLREELDKLFPSRQYSDVTFNLQSLTKLTYLGSVIKEGKRKKIERRERREIERERKREREREREREIAVRE